MAWEKYKVEHQRSQLVHAYLQGHATMTVLCNQYGISRKTGYKWVQRFLDQGEEGLRDLSKAPHNPKQCFDSSIIDRAIDLKLRKRTWGPKKISSKLQGLYPEEDWL